MTTKQTEERVTAWAERHGINLCGADLENAFEDAATNSLHELTDKWAADTLGLPCEVLPLEEFSEYNKGRIACFLKGARAAIAKNTGSTS